MKSFLDSSIIIDFLENKQVAINAVLEADEVYTSSLCAYEVILGESYRKEKGLKSKYNDTVEFFKTMATLPFTYIDAINASGIMAKLAVKGKKVKQMDALIAAQALARETTLLTTDARHFKIIGDETGLSVRII
jgi:predicted nucleic acid-binding protein